MVTIHDTVDMIFFCKFYMLDFSEIQVYPSHIESLVVIDENAMNDLAISYDDRTSHFLISAFTIADSFGVDPDNSLSSAIVHVVLDMDQDTI